MNSTFENSEDISTLLESQRRKRNIGNNKICVIVLAFARWSSGYTWLYWGKVAVQ